MKTTTKIILLAVLLLPAIDIAAWFIAGQFLFPEVKIQGGMCGATLGCYYPYGIAYMVVPSFQVALHEHLHYLRYGEQDATIFTVLLAISYVIAVIMLSVMVVEWTNSHTLFGKKSRA